MAILPRTEITRGVHTAAGDRAEDGHERSDLIYTYIYIYVYMHIYKKTHGCDMARAVQCTMQPLISSGSALRNALAA